MDYNAAFYISQQFIVATSIKLQKGLKTLKSTINVVHISDIIFIFQRTIVLNLEGLRVFKLTCVGNL